MRSLHVLFRLNGLLLLMMGGLLAAGSPEYVPGRLLVGPRQDADPATVNRALALRGATVRRQLPGLVSVLDVPEKDSTAVLESLRGSGLFAFVERDYYAHTAAVPNDPSFASQWHLAAIQAPQAWDLSTGSSGIVSAVIDSGVDPTHPDLASKLVPGWNFLNGNNDTTDILGHGTAVAGTLAAASNNGAGVAGVTWGGLIMPLAVVDANDYASYSNIAAAIQYAADHGARVINISIGGPSPSSTLQTAVDYAWGKGALIFASAMNASTSAPYYPAACNHVMAVGATDAGDNLASFSNFGSWISLTAPGSNILTTTMGGGYGYWYGTSFSSPIAAGVAALTLSVNPGLSNDALASILKKNADDLGTPGFDDYFGAGRVNAYKAALAAQPAGVTVTPGDVTLGPSQTAQFVAQVNNGSGAVAWSISPAVGTISANGLYAAPASITATQTITVTASAAGANGTARITLNAPASISVTPGDVTLPASGTAQFTAQVSNSSSPVTWTLYPAIGIISGTGLYTAPAAITASQTITVTASIPGASATARITLNPPASISVTPGDVTLSPSQTAQFTAQVSNSTSPVTWSLYPAIGIISGTGLYTAPAAITASQTITVTASIPGASATARITLNPPAGISVTPGSVTLAPSQTAQFTAQVSNSSGPVTWTLYPVIGIISGTGLYTAPAAITASQTITVTASIPGASATARITLNPPPSISVTPAAVTLGPSQTAQFTALTSNYTGPVTWSISPATGAISGTGLYAAPASITASQSVTVTASIPGASATARITLNPPPSVTVTPATVALGPSQTAQFTALVSNASGTVQWSLNPAVGSISSAGLYTAPPTILAQQGVIVVASIAGASSSASVTLVPPVVTPPPATVAPVRINAGGPLYVDDLGRTWQADANFAGGSPVSTTRKISGTQIAAIYKTARTGESTYRISEPDGTYSVTLHFAEIVNNRAGQRAFNVAINGAPALVNFDIAAAAGGANAAIDKTFTATVTGGLLTIAFTNGKTGAPLVNAIDIVQRPAQFEPIRVNAGGPDYAGTGGIVWKADAGFTGGNARSTLSAISNTADPAIYQTERWGEFGYRFAVPNGSYAVTLKFAETSQLGIGLRQFNVAIGGAPALTNFDIFAQAGGGFIALDKTFPVNVTAGEIRIDFTAGSAYWPGLNGIEIVPATASPTAAGSSGKKQVGGFEPRR